MGEVITTIILAGVYAAITAMLANDAIRRLIGE